MINLKIVKIKSYKKKSGTLIPINFNKEFPIKVKRVFFIYGKKNMSRGDHAHKKCFQVFIPIKGTISLKLEQHNKKEIILSSGKAKAIVVPNLVWCKLKFLKKDSIVAVVCNRKYEFDDYIENYKEFKKLISKKKYKNK